MSKISHILLKNPVVVPAGAKLVEAAKLMKKSGIASVLISKNSRLAGIVSVEDIMQRVAEMTNLDISVDEVMHSPELTIDSEKWLSDAITMFERCKASHITVVEHGENVGIIRADDILHTYRFCKAFFIEDLEEKAKALNIITEHYSGNSFEFQKNSNDNVTVI